MRIFFFKFEVVLTNTKRQKVFWLGDFSFCIEESCWFKLLWFIPQVRIHMNSMQQRHDLCILWNLKSVQDHISAKKRKETASVRKVAPLDFFYLQLDSPPIRNIFLSAQQPARNSSSTTGKQVLPDNS